MPPGKHIGAGDGDRKLIDNDNDGVEDGIGVSRPLAGEYRRAVEAICASCVPVFAVDIPSGIHTDTG